MVSYAQDMILCGGASLHGSCGVWSPFVRSGSASLDLVSFVQLTGANGIKSKRDYFSFSSFSFSFSGILMAGEFEGEGAVIGSTSPGSSSFFLSLFLSLSLSLCSLSLDRDEDGCFLSLITQPLKNSSLLGHPKIMRGRLHLEE